MSEAPSWERVPCVWGDRAHRSGVVLQAVKEQLKGYEKGFVAGGKNKSKNVEAEMVVVQAQLKGYSEVGLSASERSVHHA